MLDSAFGVLQAIERILVGMGYRNHGLGGLGVAHCSSMVHPIVLL